MNVPFVALLGRRRFRRFGRAERRLRNAWTSGRFDGQAFLWRVPRKSCPIVLYGEHSQMPRCRYMAQDHPSIGKEIVCLIMRQGGLVQRGSGHLPDKGWRNLRSSSFASVWSALEGLRLTSA